MGEGVKGQRYTEGPKAGGFCYMTLHQVVRWLRWLWDLSYNHQGRRMWEKRLRVKESFMGYSQGWMGRNFHFMG